MHVDILLVYQAWNLITSIFLYEEIEIHSGIIFSYSNNFQVYKFIAYTEEKHKDTIECYY